MKIIITESQFNLLIKEGVGTELEDYDPSDDGGMMKGTKKPLGEDYFPKNLVFKILDYCKLKLSGDSEVVNFENKIKNQNKIRRDDRKKMDNYLGIIMSDCRNTNLETRENYPLMCLAVTDLIVGDSDNVFSVSYNTQWQNLKKNKSNVSIDEKWTKKYKRSINCNAPKGFSQRAHCQGRKKRLKESSENDEYQDHGYDIEGIKIALKVMSDLSETYGEGIPLDFSLHEYFLKKKQYISKPILQLYIDVDTKDGEEYKLTQLNRHEINVELLHVLEMVGLYSDEKMTPYYNFHFNKRNLD